MKKLTAVLALASASLLLLGCASAPPQDIEPTVEIPETQTDEEETRVPDSVEARVEASVDWILRQGRESARGRRVAAPETSSAQRGS